METRWWGGATAGRGEDYSSSSLGELQTKLTCLSSLLYHVLSIQTVVPVQRGSEEKIYENLRHLWLETQRMKQTRDSSTIKPFGLIKQAVNDESRGQQVKHVNNTCLKVLDLDAVRLGEGLLVRGKTQVAPVHQNLEGLSGLWCVFVGV